MNLPELDNIQAAHEAKQTFLVALQRLPTRDWPRAVPGFMTELARCQIHDSLVLLTIIVDLSHQVSQLPGASNLRGPAQLARAIVEQDYFATHDTRRIHGSLERDLRDWLGSAGALSDAADVAAYITRNLRSPLTLDVLSRRFGYSPRRLSQVFRRETGLTPHGYVRQERIKRAKALVQQGEKVEAAMLLVGLRNRTNFYRAFRRYAGVNPGELRGEAR